MRLGDLSLVLEGSAWNASVKTDAGDTLTGFGPSKDDALRNLCAVLCRDAGNIELRIVAHQAFHYDGSDTFEEWWSKRR